MKKNRLLAAALTLSMMVGTAAPASAAVFTDLSGHWARTDVEYLAAQGLVSGYNDGTFKPDAAMSAVEALLFCARVTKLDAAVKQKVVSKWDDTLRDIIPSDMRTWAATDLSVCLETGIISPSELQSLASGNSLLSAIPRERVALYLARAMQLDEAAESLTSYSLNFTDKSSIDREMQPYVYLLTDCGILKGDEFNRFLPKNSVNRASMTSLMRRAMDYMVLKGIAVELPDFTDYEWLGGVITSAEANSSGATVLTVDSLVSGTHTVVVPAYAVIYEQNMRADSSALKKGTYARVNLNKSGTPTEVRLGGMPERVKGEVTAMGKDSVTLKVNGLSRTVRVDRFTEVQAGGKTGGPELLDPEAAYTGAECLVHSGGHAAAIRLTGGTREEIGLLGKVQVNGNRSATVQVVAMNGVKTSYQIPASAEVEVNGSEGKLSSTQVGDYVVLRISNEENGKVESVSVDTKTSYVRGSIRSVSSSRDELTIRNFDEGNKSVTYDVASGADITYEGEKIGLSKLDKDDYVTMRVSKNEALAIMAFPGSTSDEGTIRSITYGTPTVMEIARDDGAVVSYDLDLSNPPTIYRDNEHSSIDRLKNGDEVSITIRYNEVDTIDATPQSANASGTIQRVSMDTTGTTIEVQHADGSTASYRVSSGVSVTQDGKAISIDTLKPGFRIDMVLDGDQVLAIEVDKSASSGNQMMGEILYVNRKAGEILIQKSGDTAVTVDVDGASILSAQGGTLEISDLSSGDYITIYGSYDGLTFKATLVIRT